MHRTNDHPDLLHSKTTSPGVFLPNTAKERRLTLGPRKAELLGKAMPSNAKPYLAI